MGYPIQHIIIIGAGIAGLQAAHILSKKGYDVTIIEQDKIIGGNVKKWHKLFPNLNEANKILEKISQNCNNFKLLINTKIISSSYMDNYFHVGLSNGKFLNANAILISSGFHIFDAHRKEEYGYGIYDNVITSADLEKEMKNYKNNPSIKRKKIDRVAFVHCVGSRDEKAGNTHCSKICCITAVKQAIELKKIYPNADFFCLYMDLRMHDRYSEDFYRQAQEEFGVTFIRGRLSEASEKIDGNIQIKLEDTLICKPLKFSVDLLILMVGMESGKQTSDLARIFGLKQGHDGFFLPKEEHLTFNLSSEKGIFLAGTCKGPKNISETIADAHSAASAIDEYLYSGKK